MPGTGRAGAPNTACCGQAGGQGEQSKDAPCVKPHGSGETHAQEVGPPLSKHHACIGEQRALGGGGACVQAQWLGEPGALRPDRAGARPADITQGSRAEQCHCAREWGGRCGQQ